MSDFMGWDDHGLKFNRVSVRRHAFTLVELLVVMSIIVIVLGVGVSGLREMRGAALTQMGASEMKMAAKSAYKSAVRNKIPSAVTLVVKETGIAQGYLMAGTGSLVSYCGFDPITSPIKGVEGETFSGTATVKPGAISQGLDLSSATLTSSKNVIPGSSNISVVYMEAMVKGVTGGGTILQIGSKLQLKSDAQGYLMANINENPDFPTAAKDRLYLGGQNWTTIGIMGMHNNYSSNVYAYLFVNGTLAANAQYPITTSANSIFEQPLSIQGTVGVIDEVKAYNLSRSNPVMNDLKGGFFVSSGVAGDSSGYSGNIRKEEVILLGPSGKLISTDSASEKYVAFASVGLSGTIKSLKGASDSAYKGVKVITGAKASGLPESGFIVSYNSDAPNDYELMEYNSCNGTSLNLINRDIGAVGAHTGDRTFYYALPIIFNTSGGVK